MKKSFLALAVTGILLASAGAAGAQQLWCAGSPDWGSAPTDPGPVIFKLDGATGAVSGTMTFDAAGWMWISGVADSGRFLYASHNTHDTIAGSSMDTHDFKIGKIDRVTGAVLSDTSISGFLGQTYSQVNALAFRGGRLYAIENATSGSTIRGHALEVVLDGNGDVTGAVLGAFVGPYPDAGLDFHDGLWYATSWGYTPDGFEGSLVYTSPDIMTTPFAQVGTGDTAVEGIGMIDGWEFDAAGRLLAVTWYDVPSSATALYEIDTATWTATLLFELAPQLPPAIISLDGLAEILPVPQTRDDCKNGGWESLTRDDGSSFKNQGDCVSYVSSGN